MVKYHFRIKHGPEIGPIDPEEFRQRLEAGDVTDDTVVWRSGLINWTNYAGLRAFEEELARKQAAPPPWPVDGAVHGSSPSPKSIQCMACNQEWPDHAITMLGDKPICGNCERRVRDDPQFAKAFSMPAASLVGAASPIEGKRPTPVWLVNALTLLAVPVVCCGVLFGAMWLRYVVSKNTMVFGRPEMKMSALPVP